MGKGLVSRARSNSDFSLQQAENRFTQAPRNCDTLSSVIPRHVCDLYLTMDIK